MQSLPNVPKGYVATRTRCTCIRNRGKKLSIKIRFVCFARSIPPPPCQRISYLPPPSCFTMINGLHVPYNSEDTIHSRITCKYCSKWNGIKAIRMEQMDRDSRLHNKGD